MSDTIPELKAKIQQLEIENKKQADQIKELVQVNSNWDKYTHDLRNDHEKQLSDIMETLNQERKLLEEYTARETDATGIPGTSRDGSEELAKALGEQKEKAVKHAIAQTAKVDELKKKLKEEQSKCQELTKKLKDLEKVKYLQTAVSNLRSDKEKLEAQIAALTGGGQIPMELQFNDGNHEQYKKRLSEKDTQILVLQQQIAVFKEDFDNERKDREKAQNDLSGVHTQVKALKNHNQELQQEHYEKTLEINALRETRDQQRLTIDRLERENRELRRQLEQDMGDKYNIHIHRQMPVAQESPRHTAKVGFLSDYQKQQLRKNWTTFIDNLRVEEIVIHLFSESVLSLYQKQEIESLSTSYQKADYLMHNVIINGTQREVKAFQNALIHTGQSYLAELIPTDDIPAKAKIHQSPKHGGIYKDQTELNWKCTQCTFNNHPDSSLCAMCGNHKKTDSLPFAGIDQCDASVSKNRKPALFNGFGDLEED